jgi:hypothetical protein
MKFPSPSHRALGALDLASAVPLVALAVWFGVIDRLPFGEGRCPSCGVEGYVIGAHVAAAAWLGAVIACAAAARRQLREGVRAPGRATVVALAAVTVFVAASLLWHDLFTLPAFATLIASVVIAPLAGVRWLVVVTAYWRRPTRTDSELRRRASGTLAAGWVSLVLLLPAIFAWVWADRVTWFVF